VLDAVEAREVYLAQGLILAEDALEEFPDERLQVRAAWALHLMATYGVRADQEAVESLRGSLGARRAKAEEALRQAGILRADGTRDMGRVRSIVEGALGEDTPRTPTGLVQVGEDALIAAAEAVGDASADSPTLRHLAEIASTNVVWTTWVPPLEAAVRAPLTTRPNVLLETGRTSWWGPNMQNPPRKGGVRECFVPRPGFVYCDCDYDTIELCALAQVLLERFGRSRMAEDIQAGRDLHLGLAADLLGISYEEAARRYEEGDPSVEAARQAAKAANFGFPGGMGVAKFLIAQAAFIPRGLGPAEANAWATSLRDAWFRRYPEMRSYFAWCAELADVGMVTHPWSGRVRGGVRFTEVANGFFQGRVADGAKLALYRLTRECLVGSAPLLGSRPVLFLHDEVLAEVPEERAHEAGEAMAAVMVAAMQEVIPDVPVKSKPTLMRRWHKGAKPVRVGGRLVPSRPLVVDGKTRWVEDTKEAA
jgi:DNA polymerase I-like protein with 3'-5' exonuclease and polymerase domains